jgi:hypothetical protein
MARALAAVVGLAICSAWLTACTRPVASPAASPRGSAAGAADAGAIERDLDDASPEPPDGRWLVDDQGRRYFLERIPRAQATRTSLASARTTWGTAIDVAEEDAEFLYYKVYAPPPVSPAPATLLTGEEVRRIAEAYRVETVVTDRLTFAGFGDGLPRSGQWRQGFAIADMNGDGHPDIVHGPVRKGSRLPVIFLGDGKGGWRSWREARFPAVPLDYGDVQVGDLDGDGHLDLVLSAHLRGFTALRGDGRGQFSDWSRGLDRATGAQPSDFSSLAIRLVDWNGDGRLDLLALGEGPRRPGPRGQRPASAEGVALYLNQGDSSWRRDARGVGAPGLFGGALVLGDFNGDGRIDFAASSSVMGRRDIVGLATTDGGWTAMVVDPVRPSAYLRAVAAADFDGDGRSDLAVAYLSFEGGVWRTGLDVLYARAPGGWQRRPLVAEEGRRGVTALASGDVDGDGRRDLVALTSDGQVLVFPGAGRGFFTRERGGLPTFAAGCRGAHVELADLDGDGRDEVIASFAEEAPGGSSGGACPSEGGLMAWKVSKRRDKR